MTKRLNVFFEGLAFLLLLSFALILAFGKNFSATVTDGISLWAACVLPALFPYFFITAVMSSMRVTGKLSNKLSPITKRLFNTGGSTGYAFFTSVISGYPVGAKTVADLKNKNLLSDTEAVRAAAFCSTSSPMFLMGSVGSIMFNNAHFGLCLFVTHLLSSIAVGILFSFYKRKDKPQSTFSSKNDKRVDNVLYESVYSAVISILVVGGLITVFYLITEILTTLGVLTPLVNLLKQLLGDKNIAEGIVYGLFECTKGLKALSCAGINFFTLPICAALCGFGGLSVIAQSISYLKSAKIKTAPFVFAKLIGAVINFIIGVLVSIICF
ncbi:MAG: hypothetical protein IKB30_00650 [Clostridia bacterium]|nr:hypothetical protein [Clostridia bacterium]